MENKRVVVTGLGALTPLGNNIEEYWSNLIQGVSGSDSITHFDATKFKTRFACEVKNYDPKDHFDRKELRKLDLFSQYAVVAADEAIYDSGLQMENEDETRVGVIWGSGIGGINSFLQEVKNFYSGDGTPRFNPFFIPRMISDIAAGHISMRYGLRGINYATVSACATSTHSIIDGLTHLWLGKADVLVVGGSEAAINEAGIGGFNAAKAISTNNEEYKTASRPFDKTRDGFVMGEGGGALVLETYEHAVKRGAPIYAELVAGGMSADAYHLTAPDPEGKGAKKVMENVLADAGLAPEEVQYINVHGTSTPIGDVAELKAAKSVFGDHIYSMNLSSTKSMTGHLLGAAGAIEAIATILAIDKNKVPPTINHQHNDPDIDNDLNLTLNETQEREVKIAMSNTFGFGGHNASVIFRQME